ncbi:unnamed protein product [Brassica oleracea]
MSRKKQVMAAGMVAVVAGSHPWNSLIQALLLLSLSFPAALTDQEISFCVFHWFESFLCGLIFFFVCTEILWRSFAWSHSSSYRYVSEGTVRN